MREPREIQADMYISLVRYSEMVDKAVMEANAFTANLDSLGDEIKAFEEKWAGYL